MKRHKARGVVHKDLTCTRPLRSGNRSLYLTRHQRARFIVEEGCLSVWVNLIAVYDAGSTGVQSDDYDFHRGITS